MTASHSSALMEKIIRSRRMPALLTRTLRPPYVETARSTSPVAKSQSPMSPPTPIPGPPHRPATSLNDLGRNLFCTLADVVDDNFRAGCGEGECLGPAKARACAG